MDRVQDPGAFYAAQQVLPTLVEAGRGHYLAYGRVGVAARQGEVLAPGGRQVWLAGARAQSIAPEREENTMLSPDAIAETYWRLHTQDPTAWTLELDLRPSMESI
jgi:hypothetical protein